MASSEPPAASHGLLAPVTQGALYMVLAALGFSVMNVIIRLVSAELDPLQIAFFRNLFALAMMLPWLARTRGLGLRTRRLGMHAWRACFGFLAMVAWFYSVTLLPLAEAVALNFTVPLFATIGAALVLGEVVRARRWTATVVGFLGVLIIVRPGFADVSLTMALPVLAAAFMAVATLIVKSLSSSETPAAIVAYMNLFLTPLSLVPALFVWRWPDAETLGLLICLGAAAALAHIALTRAYSKADASAVLPFDYLRLPLVAAFAYLLFDQVPDPWTWVGGAVIAGAVIYIAHREAQLARAQRLSQAASLSAQERS